METIEDIKEKAKIIEQKRAEIKQKRDLLEKKKLELSNKYENHLREIQQKVMDIFIPILPFLKCVDNHGIALDHYDLYKLRVHLYKEEIVISRKEEYLVRFANNSIEYSKYRKYYDKSESEWVTEYIEMKRSISSLKEVCEQGLLSQIINNKEPIIEYIIILLTNNKRNVIASLEHQIKEEQKDLEKALIELNNYEKLKEKKDYKFCFIFSDGKI